FSSRRRHTRFSRDWSSDVCSSDLATYLACAQRRSGAQFQGGVRPAFYMDVIEDAALRPAAQQLELSAEDLRQLQRCLPESRQNEIGRASCRERAWLTVSGVAVSNT